MPELTAPPNTYDLLNKRWCSPSLSIVDIRTTASSLSTAAPSTAAAVAALSPGSKAGGGLREYANGAAAASAVQRSGSGSGVHSHLGGCPHGSHGGAECDKLWPSVVHVTHTDKHGAGISSAAATADDRASSCYRFGPTRFSVIPKVAVGKISLRFVPEQDHQTLIECLQQHIEKRFAMMWSANKVELQVCVWWQGARNSWQLLLMYWMVPAVGFLDTPGAVQEASQETRKYHPFGHSWPSPAAAAVAATTAHLSLPHQTSMAEMTHSLGVMFCPMVASCFWKHCTAAGATKPTLHPNSIHNTQDRAAAATACAALLQVHSVGDWWEADPQSQLFQMAERAVRREWGEPPLYVREGGTMPVASLIEKMLGAPALMIPMGQSSDNCHLANERLRRINLIKGKNVVGVGAAAVSSMM